MPQSNFDSTELPAIKPRTHCVLIPRDPNFIYAYWDYSQEDIDRARNQLKFESEDSQLILRVYDITLVKFNGSNANHTWDLEVGFSTKNWYIHVWQDNADYCVELGFNSRENYFVPLVRSNTVRTPAKTASKRDDLIWQDIKLHRESQPYIKENIQENIKDRYKGLMKQQSKKKFHKEKQPQTEKIYQLTVQDIHDYYTKIFTRLSQKGKLKNVSWQKVQPLMTSPGLINEIHPGASRGGHGENKGGSESLSSFQAGAGASEGRLINRKFFFEIWAELIVYGRTEPDATVSLNAKGIKLNPDGTFSLRYALPDGEIPFKFIAQSSDNLEQRHINTRVERERTISFPKMLGDFHG